MNQFEFICSNSIFSTNGRSKTMHSFKPCFYNTFKKGYSLSLFFNDLTAGIIVGIVALPLAIAFAIASGVKPEQGLITAIIAGLSISLLSGSKYQIGGPTGAFIVIVFGIVKQYGMEGLFVATMMAGVILILMGIAKLGSIITFMPYPVTIGFTSGIALIIFISQLGDFLGISSQNMPSEFLGKINTIVNSIGNLNKWSLALGMFSLCLLIIIPKIAPRVPAPIIALLLGSAIVAIFNIPVETIGSRFGDIPNYLPSPKLPHINLDIVKTLIGPAFSIAILGAIESLLSAVVADGMTGTRHNSNMELISQGIANIISPLFTGIAATGAIARTATNIKNGAKSPVAGIVHAITLFLIMIFLGKWAALIPMPVLAAILIIVAINMSEWRLFLRIFKSTKSDTTILIATFLLTVILDLTVAIQVGVVLASLLFMRRMALASQPRYITNLLNECTEDEIDPMPLSSRKVPENVEVFEIYGPFFFGVADRFKNALDQIQKKPDILILRMRHVSSIDATALKALEELVIKSVNKGTILILSGVHSQPKNVLKQSGLLDKIGIENITSDIDQALSLAKQILKIEKE